MSIFSLFCLDGVKKLCNISFCIDGSVPWTSSLVDSEVLASDGCVGLFVPTPPCVGNLVSWNFVVVEREMFSGDLHLRIVLHKYDNLKNRKWYIVLSDGFKFQFGTFLVIITNLSFFKI